MDQKRILSQAPPASISVSDSLVVRRYVRSDAEGLRDAVASSVGHLGPWMAWIQHEPQTVQQREALIDDWNAQWDAGTDFAMGIFENGLCIGSTGYHLRGPEGTIEIGYWLATSHVGRGIMTAVVEKLTRVACSIPGIDSVEIVTDVANAASGAVAARCGYEVVETFAHQPEAPAESGQRLRWARRCSG